MLQRPALVGHEDPILAMSDPAIYPRPIERKGGNRVKWLQWEQTLFPEQIFVPSQED